MVVFGAWGLCLLPLTLLDFGSNLGQMEMAAAVFLDLPGVLIFWEHLAQPCGPLYSDHHSTSFPGGHYQGEAARGRLTWARGDSFSE